MKPVRARGTLARLGARNLTTLRKGEDSYLLKETPSAIWPYIDGVRGIECLVAELEGQYDQELIEAVLEELVSLRLITMKEENFRDRVLNLAGLSLSRNTDQSFSPALMRGAAGWALYFLAEGVLRDDQSLLDTGRRFLQLSLENITSVAGSISFYEGPLGILWVSELWRKKTGEALLDRRSMKRFLRHYFHHHTRLPPGRFEFLYGTSGWALASDLVDRGTRRTLSSIVVSQLESCLEPNAFGVGLLGVEDLRNFQHPNARRSRRSFPGLAHGLAGALTALLTLKQQDALGSAGEELISPLSETLLRLERETGPAPLPRYFDDSHFDRQDWCHGDGGIGLTLLLLSKISGEASHRKIGVRVLARALAAEPEAHNPGLCHGSGGKLALSIIGTILTGKSFSRAHLSRMHNSYKPNLNLQSFQPGQPIITTPMGASLSLCALQDPEFISFLFPFPLA